MIGVRSSFGVGEGRKGNPEKVRRLCFPGRGCSAATCAGILHLHSKSHRVGEQSQYYRVPKAHAVSLCINNSLLCRNQPIRGSVCFVWANRSKALTNIRAPGELQLSRIVRCNRQAGLYSTLFNYTPLVIGVTDKNNQLIIIKPTHFGINRNK